MKQESRIILIIVVALSLFLLAQASQSYVQLFAWNIPV